MGPRTTDRVGTGPTSTDRPSARGLPTGSRASSRSRPGGNGLAVVEPGVVTAGDAVEVVDRPSHGTTVPEVFRAFMGDAGLAVRVLEARILGDDDHAALERRLARTR